MCKYLRYFFISVIIEEFFVISHCWEALADGYLAKGAFTSALKCYEKALELSEHALYPTLQTAFIKKVGNTTLNLSPS